MPDLTAIKAALADLPGIATLTQANVGGRMVFGFGASPASFTVGVDIASTDDQIIAALRKVYADRGEANHQPAPAPPQMPQPPLKPQGATVSVASPGGFAAGIKAMLDEARGGVARARADGLAQVKAAVSDLNDVEAATVRAAQGMVKSIQNEVADARAELGQITNDV